jgi:tartrate-resistant acid phosphatase type 5
LGDRITVRILAISVAFLLSGCAAMPAPQAPTGQPVVAPPASTSLLLFGDHGYDLDYLSADERLPARTLEQAVKLQREEWAEDKRPPGEFKPSALVRLPETGGYVDASGMMPVAKAMAALCTVERCDSATMLGDNIYPDGPTGGADGRSDAKRFADILLRPYEDFGKLGPQFRIYATLGNHDWRTSREAALAEVRYLETTPPFYMDGLIYQVKPPAAGGDVELFVLDTEVLLSSTTVYEAELADDGSELPGTVLDEYKPWSRPQTERERNMVQWLETALRNSTAKWKIVMGHHPIWSSAGSKFHQARTLRGLILPTLCKYADMYVAGHEHTLELHSDNCAKAVPGAALPPLPHIVSGAAAKQRPLNTAFMRYQQIHNPELTTYYAKGLIWGYVHLKLEGEDATARVFVTPNSGDGTNILETTHVYKRRSGSLAASR